MAVYGSNDRPSAMPSPPPEACGAFLRVVSINDVYKLDNYPRVATAVAAARASVAVHPGGGLACLNGDFLSPCTVTALDGGKAMADALSYARIDYACLGNKEFDLPLEAHGEQVWSPSHVPSLVRSLARFTHGKVLNSNVLDTELAALPRFDCVRVGERTAVLAGLLTPDRTKYRPTGYPHAMPMAEACNEVWREAKAALGASGDLFLPMTHQPIKDDCALAACLAEHPELGVRTPILLGGHDHEVTSTSLALLPLRPSNPWPPRPAGGRA